MNAASALARGWPRAGSALSAPIHACVPTLPDGSPWPRISIITPTFNQARYIEDTLLSVQRQNYPAVEHIVVDGGSTDGTHEILARHAEGLAHVISGPDRGQGDALNKGFARANGTILTWLNSDDLLAPGALFAVALAQWQSKADVVAGVCELFDDPPAGERAVVSGAHLTSCGDGVLPLDDVLDIEHRWLHGQFFYQPEVMFTREVFDRAGGRVDDRWFYSMDYELWLRLAHAGARLNVIGASVAMFRRHAEQKTQGERGGAGGFRAELPRVREEFLARTGYRWSPRDPAPMKRRLTIAMVNDSGYYQGAGIAHRRLAAALEHAGHRVVPVAANNPAANDYPPAFAGGEMVDAAIAADPDLVIVGNLHGAALSPSVAGRIAAHAPTAVVAHDLWWLTGRCPYPGACEKFRVGCDAACACGATYPPMEPGEIAPAWAMKRRVFAAGGERIAVLANSAWTKEQVRSALAVDPLLHAAKVQPAVEQIRFGVELDVFKPMDRAECRRQWGLPEHGLVIFSSASSLADARKGLAILGEALEKLDLKDATVICTGWPAPGREPAIRGLRAVGYVNEPERMASLFCAADVFVGPSVEEALGMVFTEAAACGVPSVGFAVGGVPEAIVDGVTGVAAPEVSAESLAAAIARLAGDEELRRRLGAYARIYAENFWSPRSAYHSVQAALRRTPLARESGLFVSVDFAAGTPSAPAVRQIGAAMPRWRAMRGWEWWDPSVREADAPDVPGQEPRARWMVGQTATLELDGSRAGEALVSVYCRAAAGVRSVTLRIGDAADHLPASTEWEWLVFRVPLDRGPTAAELRVDAAPGSGEPQGRTLRVSRIIITP